MFICWFLDLEMRCCVAALYIALQQIQAVLKKYLAWFNLFILLQRPMVVVSDDKLLILKVMLLVGQFQRLLQSLDPGAAFVGVSLVVDFPVTAVPVAHLHRLRSLEELSV